MDDGQRRPIYRVRMVVLIAATGIGGCGIGGCGSTAPQSSSSSDDAVLSQQVTAVALASDSGGVTVDGAAGAAQVSLHRLISYQGRAPAGTTYWLTNGVLTLGGCGRRCSVDYTITVPQGISVSGNTSTGAVSLTGVDGVNVTTASGGITLADISGGTVNVQTSNGKIEGHGLRSDSVHAQTSNGPIDLEITNPQDVTAQTANGDITLTVPNAPYQVTADTKNGHKAVDVPNDPTARYHLDLRTNNGTITVTPG